MSLALVCPPQLALELALLIEALAAQPVQRAVTVCCQQ